MSKSKEEELSEFAVYMNGAMEGFDDLPDGAFFAVAQEMVEQYNEDMGTNLDPHEGMLQWIHEVGEDLE